MKNKKAAIEMSIGTIVVIVLAMTMLIMGLVLIKSIFGGAKYNVDTINEKVKEQINAMFTEDDSARIVVYLPSNTATMKKGSTFNVQVAIRNSETGTSAQQFDYEVILGEDATDLKTQCGITEKEAMSYIILGKTGTVTVSPGEFGTARIRITVPKDGPICSIRYNIEVSKKGETELYTGDSIDVDIK
jgi:hypothetical protein